MRGFAEIDIGFKLNQLGIGDTGSGDLARHGLDDHSQLREVFGREILLVQEMIEAES